MIKRGKQNFVKFISIILILMLALAGCSANDNKTKQSEGQNTPPSKSESPVSTTPPPEEIKRPDPVTLTFYEPSAGKAEELFMEQYGNHIQNKFDHITVKFARPDDTNHEAHMTTLLSANENIDIILTGDIMYYRIVEPFDLQFDISDLIKQHQYDLSQLATNAIEAVKGLSGGKMYGLPFGMSSLGLIYNVDLFEKFGVKKPWDGMTWDETYDLARLMTRVEDNTQYRGFVTQFYNIAWNNQLSVGFVDPQTDKSLFDTDERWKKHISNIIRFFEFEGSVLQSNERSFGAIRDMFLKHQTAAMYLYTLPGTGYDVNWDVVSVPEYSELPGVGPITGLEMLMIPNISKNKDAAFEVISWLTSEEYQTEISRTGRFIPVHINDKVRAAYAQDVEHLQGKNVKALLRNQPAAPYPPTPFNRTGALVMEKTLYDLAMGIGDVNTALREAAEETERNITAAKSQ